VATAINTDIHINDLPSAEVKSEIAVKTCGLLMYNSKHQSPRILWSIFINV